MGAIALLLAWASFGPTPASSDSVDGTNPSTYFRLRADDRDCASPDCGGFWVSRVNRRQTHCPATDTRARECYVAAVSYRNQLGLDPATFAAFRAEVEQGRGLLRGRLTTTSLLGRTFNRLVAHEGWQARPGLTETPRSPSHLLQFAGFECVRAPCFNIHVATLNTSDHTDVSEIDLTQTGASDKDQQAAMLAVSTQSPGLIAAGRFEARPDGGVVFVAATLTLVAGT